MKTAEETLKNHPYLKVWFENLGNSEIEVCNIEQALWAMEEYCMHIKKVLDFNIQQNMNLIRQMADLLAEQKTNGQLNILTNEELCHKANQITKELYQTENSSCFGNMEIFMQKVLINLKSEIEKK